MSSVDMREVGLGFPAYTAVDQYTVVSYLGEGGNGVVYKALAKSGESFALKFLNPKRIDDQKDYKLFCHEYDLLKKHHVCPAMPHAYRFGKYKGRFPYFALELLSSFDSQLKAHSKTGDLDAFVGWFMGLICDAVKRLHDCGIYHRDIKLDNIMWRTIGSPMPVLIDFGIAYDDNFPEKDLLENYLKTSGTPASAAPEQFKGEDQFRKKEILQAQDVYAFGNLIAECFSTSGNESDRKRMVCDGRPVRRFPVTPPQWLQIESICRARAWWDRYQSIDEVREAIEKRVDRYRDWVGTLSVLHDSVASQKRVDRKFLSEPENASVVNFADEVRDGRFELKGRTVFVEDRVQLLKPMVVEVVGPGSVSLNLDGVRGTVLVVRNDAVVVNTASAYDEDGVIYCLLDGCLQFTDLSSEHMFRGMQRVFNVRSLGAQVFYGKDFRIGCPNIAEYLGSLIRSHIGEESWKVLIRVLPMECLRRESMTAVFKKACWDKGTANSRTNANRVLQELRRRIFCDERLRSNAALKEVVEKFEDAIVSATPDNIEVALAELSKISEELAAGKYLGPVEC